MADGWKFEGSKSAQKKAKTFQIESNFYKVLTNAIMDLLITGDAYILKLSVDASKIKSVITELTKTLAKAFNIDMSKQEGEYEAIVQDVTTPRDLQLLKASTMHINFDETGKVSNYTQNCRGKTRVYKTQDVIHLTLFNVGGQPYGFTPLEPLLSDVATLIFAKDFAGKYFENDGIPYFIFNLPEATPDDRNYELLKTELKELKQKANKYRSLVTTGPITVEQVNKFNKDMEFAKLIQHFTQLILMGMGVPPR
jgi:phage portal protein BeeE